MNFPISISRTRLLQILGVLGIIFHFYSNSNRKFCEQTLETMIKRHILQRWICVCAVCLCPQALKYLKKGTCPASQKLLACMGKMIIYLGNHPNFHLPCNLRHSVNTSGRVDFSSPGPTKRTLGVYGLTWSC